MRADFYAKASVFPDLGEAISRDQVLVGPMAEPELMDAIKKPANNVNVDLESGLMEMLIRDMRSEAGALPFLQDALTQIWEQQKNRRLTVQSYKLIGRLEGAIEYRANQFFDRLTPEQQRTCRRVLLRLVQPGEGTEDTKRRVKRDELGSEAAVEEMIQLLAQERLITTEGADADGDGHGFVEVSHEALIRAWTKLRKWIDEDRDALRFQHQLTLDARTWQRTPDDAFLYRGTRLGLAIEWMKSHAEILTAAEQEFLSASKSLRDRERAEKAAAAARLRRWAWTAGVAALAATVLAAFAVRSTFNINKAKQNEQAQRELADQRALEALHESRIADAQRLATQAEDLLESSPVEGARTAGIAVRTLFSAEGEIREEDLRYPLKTLRSALDELDRQRKELVLGRRPTLMKAMLSDSGRWLLAQMDDREVNLWDLRSGVTQPIRLPKTRRRRRCRRIRKGRMGRRPISNRSYSALETR